VLLRHGSSRPLHRAHDARRFAVRPVLALAHDLVRAWLPARRPRIGTCEMQRRVPGLRERAAVDRGERRRENAKAYLLRDHAPIVQARRHRLVADLFRCVCLTRHRAANRLLAGMWLTREATRLVVGSPAPRSRPHERQSRTRRSRSAFSGDFLARKRRIERRSAMRNARLLERPYEQPLPLSRRSSVRVDQNLHRASGGSRPPLPRRYVPAADTALRAARHSGRLSARAR